MKLLLYTALLAGVWLFHIQGSDVGELIPVEVLAISENENTVTVRTDTGDWGAGAGLDEAFADLKRSASGIIYLDTAEYVLLEPGAKDRAADLRKYLKRGTRICRAEKGLALDKAADFLSVHEPGVKLEDAGKSSEIPTIQEKNGRFEVN